MNFLKKISWNIKLLTLLIITAALPASIVVFNVLGIVEDELKSKINDELIYSSESIAEHIDNYYNKTFKTLEIAKQNMLNDNLGGEEKISIMMSILKSTDNIIGIAILYEEKDKTPQEVVSLFKDSTMVGNKKIPFSFKNKYASSNYYYLNLKNLFLSAPEYDKNQKLWLQTVKISLPLNKSNKLFMYALLNGNEIADFIVSNPLYRSGDIFILDRNKIALFTTALKSGSNNLLYDEGIKMLSLKQNLAVINNYNIGAKNEFVASFALIQQIPWVVITSLKKADAYFMVTEIVNVFQLWLGISLVAAIFISYLFSRRLSLPIKKMSKAALQIAQGNFNTSITYEARDSIGLLGKSLSKMSIDLDSSFNEIKRQHEELEDYSKNLEKKVQERTEQLVRANEEINKSYQQVVELNKEKNEFLGIAAHDLKNPLTIIRGYADLIIQDAELPDELKQDFTKEILNASDRMFDIVTKLLDVNTIEQGKMKIKKEPVLLSSIVNKIIYQNNEKALKKCITIYSTTDESIVVEIDENITLQIVDNLVSNAIKFSPANKNIYLSSKLNGDNDFVSLIVKDEGPGFTEEDKKKVFGKFARLSAKPTAGEHSTGLGLSIVKKLVELQCSNIYLESELGKGATFILNLPKGKVK
jgi:signal transduction histidine kinase